MVSYVSSLSNSGLHLANVDVIADVKSKIVVSPRHFFADLIFSATSKVQNYKKQSQKIIPMSKQIHTYYIFQGILKIFSNIYALLFIFNKH